MWKVLEHGKSFVKKGRSKSKSSLHSTSPSRQNFSGTFHRKKRAKSCERDGGSGGGGQTDQKDDNGAPATAAIVQQRPDSGYSEGLEFPTGRRFSETITPLGAGAAGVSRRVSVEPGAGPEMTDEEREEKYARAAQCKLRELLDTEITYVERNLKEVVEGYYESIEETKKDPEGRVRIPADLACGKDRIIFGNIRDIYDFHKRCILPEIEKAIDDPCVLRTLFDTRKDMLKKKYGRFCLNKPKSEYIISQHNDKYFAVLRLKEGFQQTLSTQMMTPIQRVTRYQLLLHDVVKNLRQAGPNKDDVYQDVLRAYEIAHEIAEYANNMMIAGRIKGFNGDVTSQGLLLKRGSASCFKRKSAFKTPKIRPCQVFVFEETIMVCHNLQPLATGADLAFPQNLEFFASFKMNKVIVREMVKNDSVFMFELERQDDGCGPGSRQNQSASSSSSSANHREEPAAVVVQCDSEEQRDEWLKMINDQIRKLKDIAKRLEKPRDF